MGWRVAVTDREGRPVRAEQLTLTPAVYSAHVWGGPERAEIRVEGSGDALWQALNWLRGWVEIRNPQGNLVWWGYVVEVQVGAGTVAVGLTLEETANRVRVAYTYMGADGRQRRGTTAWAEDTTLQALYGIKEAQLSLADTSPGQATATRARALAARKNPRATLGMEALEGGRLICSGVWQTLGWQSYSQPEGREAHEAESDQEVVFATDHEDAAQRYTQVAQKVQLATAAGWSVLTVGAKVKKVGSGAGSLRFRIAADSAGSPGAVLATATVAAGSVTTGMAWVSVDLGAMLALSPATNYWVMVDCTGTATVANGYSVGVETAKTYTRGEMKVYVSSWAARSPDADMPFLLLGSVETSTQMEEMLTSGQFVTSVDMRAATGVSECQYRDGTQTILVEVERLLEVGTASEAGLRARVGSGREVIVEVEPSSSEIEWLLGRDGRLRNAVGGLAEVGLVPAGQWVRIEAVPGRVGLLTEAARFFVESAEFVVDGEMLRLSPRTVATA